MEEKGHSIRNRIVATVVSGLLLAGALAVLPSVWLAIKAFFLWLGGLLTTTASIPVWGLLPLSALALISVLRIAASFLPRQEPSLPLQDYTAYTQDTFRGITWRWRWISGRIVDLYPYCPTDDTLLVHNDWVGSYTEFHCETCRKMIAIIQGGDHTYVQSFILRQIDRKVRNDEWKQIVEKQLPNR
jgi:hypothetical protein